MSSFDLALAFPQWQGSGRPENLRRGADAAAAVCQQFAPMSQVPLIDSNEDAHGVRRWGAIEAQFLTARDLLAASGAQRVLTAGGDCAVDIAIIDYLAGVYPRLTIIWIDAHPDANTPDTSPSGSFHGMPVGAIMGRAPEPMRSWLGGPFDPTRFYYFGLQVGDDGDRALQSELALKTLEPDMIVTGPVHIHFDLDVLDPAEFPYLSYTDGKLGIDDAVALVSRIARNGDIVGLTLTEFSPATAEDAVNGAKVITRLCEAAVGQ